MAPHSKTKLVASFSKDVKIYLHNLFAATDVWKHYSILDECLNDKASNWKTKFNEICTISFTDNHCDDELVQILSNLFVFCMVKHPCKSILKSILKDCSDKKPAVFIHVTKAFTDLCQSCTTLDVSACQIIQTYELSISSNFLNEELQYDTIIGAVDCIKQHIKVLQQNETKLPVETSVLNLLSDDLKCLNSFLNKHEFFCNKKAIELSLCYLQDACVYLLKQEQYEGACWNAAALLLPNLVLTVSTLSFYEMVYTVFSMEKSFTLLKDTNSNLCQSAKLAVCNGILVFLSHEHTNLYEEQCETQQAKPNATKLCTIMMKAFDWVKLMSKCIIGIPDEIAFGRCILQWCITLRVHVKKVNLTNEDFSHVLKWIMPQICMGLDHATDLVRHQTRDALENILKVAYWLSQNELANFDFVRGMLVDVLKWSWHKRALYVAINCILQHVSPSNVTNHQPDIVSKILSAICDQSLAPYASNLFCTLAQTTLDLCSDEQSAHFDFIMPILEALQKYDEHHSRLLLDYCLKKILKLFGTKGLNYIISNFAIEKDRRLNILIMCLSTAQQLGLLQKREKPLENDDWRPGVKFLVIKQALVHPSSQIRIDAFSLICNCWKPSELLQAVDLDLIVCSIPYNLTVQCPAFRQQLLCLLKKLLSRIKLNHQKVCKELLKKNSPISCDELTAFKNRYESFMKWLIDFLFDQLFEGACFSRRYVCLILLTTLFEISGQGQGLCPNMKTILSKDRIDTLYRTMHDNYEENRELALKLMTSYGANALVKNHFEKNHLQEQEDCAIKQCRKTYKPEECKDAAFQLRLIVELSNNCLTKVLGICQSILAQLNTDLQMAETNLWQALSSSPLYASLYCIRMLLLNTQLCKIYGNTGWRELIQKCTKACFAVFEAVFPVVGSVSPEGHLPQMMDNTENDDKNSYDNLPDLLRPLVDSDTQSTHGDLDERLAAQRVLVSCWRSAKESSLLLETIAKNCPCDSTPDSCDGLVLRQQLLDIGLHLRRQLMNARHRGAFEIAYSAFKAYCPILWRNENHEMSSYVEKWANEIVDNICDPVKSKALCSTRRSAGLPFLAQALLGSEKNSKSRACLRHAMSSLLAILEDDEKSSTRFDVVSKVHALNVIRGLIRDASLGEEVQPFLSQCVIVAIKGIACRTWSVRNSSTLLFSALVTRIFGVKREKDLENSAKNRMSSHEFFTRLPNLREFLLNQLKQDTDDKTIVGVSYSLAVQKIEKHSRTYPILLLLSRLYPSPSSNESSTSCLNKFVPYLKRCLESPILKIRAMAATAISCVVPNSELTSTIHSLCVSTKHGSSQNHFHGCLLTLMRLQAKCALASCKNSSKLNSPDDVTIILSYLSSNYWIGSRCNRCPMSRALYLDLLIQVISDDENKVSENDDKRVTSLLMSLHKDAMIDVSAANGRCTPGQSFLDAAFGKFLVCLYLWQVSTTSSIGDVLSCDHVDIRVSALTTFENKFQQGYMIASKDREPLFNIMATLVEQEKDERVLRLVYGIFPHLTSAPNYEMIIRRGLHHAEQLSSYSSLLKAIVICLADLVGRALATNNSHHITDAQHRWLQLSLALFAPGVEDCTEVRRAFAESLAVVAFQLLVKQPAESPVFTAWRVLLAMLIDEDESVRLHASLLVHKVALQCGVREGAPFIDALALEVAMDCLFELHGTSHAEQCRNILRDVTAPSSVNGKSKEAKHDDVKLSRVFDRGETSTYVEAHVMSRLVGRFMTYDPARRHHQNSKGGYLETHSATR
uniref:tRNA (32-2'-O)-methyltransferase regulator THADA n=1 Tax=Phallusia mammillata TaxID=59560 RepID=A0A6F9DU09_9ASCI|nr:thyroid adenoma-associated protein homolog [Phallusia mammillata]